jgi:hypothetical protein
MTKRASFQGDIIPGMLLLIDIEKAFDSISWMFIESFSYISLTSVSIVLVCPLSDNKL